MILLAECGWTLLRAGLVCALVIPLARGLATALVGGDLRAGISMGLILLCAMPDLAVGYAWADAGLRLGGTAVIAETLYILLLVGKLLPMATVLCAAVPREPLSLTARHCLQLAGIPLRDRVWMTASGLAPALVPVTAIVFLLAFQDFELAARLGVRAWPVRLFDLHAREGLPLTDSVQLAVVPALMELLVILPALVLAVPESAAREPTVGRRGDTRTTLLMGMVVVPLLAGVCVIPGALVLRDTYLGGHVLLRDAVYREQLPREIGQGMFVATVSAVASFLGGGLIAENWRRRPWLAALLVPGLLGGLVLSLAGRWSVQAFDAVWEPATGRPGLYRTPVPLIVVQAVLLLPKATLIAALLETFTRTTALHLGELLAGASDRNQRETGAALLWHGRRRGEFWSLVLLAWWGYWDLTTFALLAPTGFVSAPVRLYNFMHYRQNTVLSAMLFAAIVAPAALVVCVYPLVRHWRRTTV